MAHQRRAGRRRVLVAATLAATGVVTFGAGPGGAAPGVTEKVSVDSNENDLDDLDSTGPSMSADGLHVAFMTETIDDIYVRNRANGTTTQVNFGGCVAPCSGPRVPGFFPAISGDGRYVAFLSGDAETLRRDLATGT